MSKTTSILTSQSRVPPVQSSTNNHSQNENGWREKVGNSTFRDGSKSVTSRSVITKRSKGTSAQTKRNQSRISSEPASEGYVEFARRIDNIEKGIAVAYFSQCVLRMILESCFLYLQYRIFDFKVPELYKCRRWPCPNTVSSNATQSNFLLGYARDITPKYVTSDWAHLPSLDNTTSKKIAAV